MFKPVEVVAVAEVGLVVLVEVGRTRLDWVWTRMEWVMGLNGS